MAPPAGLSEAIIASVILAMGLVASGFAALHWKSGDRTALWFGLFACLYGVRLAGESELIQPLLREVTWRYLDAFITYAIVTPFALFIESLFGPGWRNTLRRAWQAAAIWALAAVANDLVRHQPGATLWLNPTVVLTLGAIGIAHVLVRWGQERWPPESRVALLGGLIFISASVYQTLGGEVQIEHFAMLSFMASLGYFVALRALASEARLVMVSRELELARRIQQSILPRSLPDFPGLRLAARYVPMSEIGGDFYDFDTRHPSRLGLIVADVSGHGIPAALVASMVKIAFRAESDRLDTPGLALGNLNRTLCGNFSGAYVTACCGIFDLPNALFRFASAGHPGPWLRRKEGALEKLDQSGLLLAFDPEARYPTIEVALKVGDRLLFFSDGLLEARNARDEFFGEVRLEPLLASRIDLAADPFLDQLLAELHGWVGPDAPFQDDVTMVVVDLEDPG